MERQFSHRLHSAPFGHDKSLDPDSPLPITALLYITHIISPRVGGIESQIPESDSVLHNAVHHYIFIHSVNIESVLSESIQAELVSQAELKTKRKNFVLRLF